VLIFHCFKIKDEAISGTAATAADVAEQDSQDYILIK
jgi:hypothetical protein